MVEWEEHPSFLFVKSLLFAVQVLNVSLIGNDDAKRSYLCYLYFSRRTAQFAAFQFLLLILKMINLSDGYNSLYPYTTTFIVTWCFYKFSRRIKVLNKGKIVSYIWISSPELIVNICKHKTRYFAIKYNSPMHHFNNCYSNSLETRRNLYNVQFNEI